MSFGSAVRKELREVGTVFVYFAIGFLLILLLRKALLEQYDIQVSGVSRALIGALIVSKVVVILGHTRAATVFDRQPLGLHVIAGSAIYTAGVALILLLEHAFEIRGEAGGFGPALAAVFRDQQPDHFLATLIVVFVIFLGYLTLVSLTERLGEEHPFAIFFRRPDPPT